jgi:hypothetical protein
MLLSILTLYSDSCSYNLAKNIFKGYSHIFSSPFSGALHICLGQHLTVVMGADIAQIHAVML